MHIKIAAVVRVLLNGGVERVNKVENYGKLDLIDLSKIMGNWTLSTVTLGSVTRQCCCHLAGATGTSSVGHVGSVVESKCT